MKLPVHIDKGTGTPLVLLHGLGNNYKSWQFVLEHIDYTKWRVIVLDLLGFGDAPKPSGTYAPRRHSEAVLETLDELGIDSAVMAGHSMGCIVAIDIASAWPKRSKALALFGAPLYRKKPRTSWWRRLIRTEGMYFSLFETIQQYPDAVQAGGAIANELLPFVKGMEITEETWPAFTSSLEHTIMQYESYKQATKLRVPTIFINGILDIFIIKRNAKAVRRFNRTYVSCKRALGPHELTPRQGKVAVRIIDTLLTKKS